MFLVARLSRVDNSIFTYFDLLVSCLIIAMVEKHEYTLLNRPKLHVITETLSEIFCEKTVTGNHTCAHNDIL